jgi:hypothetical protein
MSMVMKITGFLFSVDQGYVYAMLSSNMIDFGWELAIIETEVNSSRGNNRSVFFWNSTNVIMSLTWSQLMRLKTHEPASKLPTRRLWYISGCSFLCLKCICWCADHWTDQWKSATILVSIEFVSTFWSPWLSSGSILCHPFQPCHLNKYFFATWNVWWFVPAIVECQIVVSLQCCSILAQRIFDWVLKKNHGHAHSGQTWATWNLNTLLSWCLLMSGQNWNFWYLVISPPHTPHFQTFV